MEKLVEKEVVLKDETKKKIDSSHEVVDKSK